MDLYSATITDIFGSHQMLFRAESRPTADHVRRCLRLLPTARIWIEYVGEIEAVPLVSAAGPAPVSATGRASG